MKTNFPHSSLADSPETLFSHLSDDKSSAPLDNPDIENDSNESEDVVMKSGKSNAAISHSPLEFSTNYLTIF